LPSRGFVDPARRLHHREEEADGDQVLYTLSVLPAASGDRDGTGLHPGFHKPYFLIYGTFWIIIINIIICNFTLGVLSSIANLKQIDKSMEEAAVSLEPTHRHVHAGRLPLTKTAFFSNVAFFFMRAMTTISAVIFLSRQGEAGSH